MNKKRQHILFFLAFLGINLLFYGFNLGDFFVSDDFDWLNITVNSQTSLVDKFTGNYYGLHGVGGSFRPLVNVIFAIQHFFFGLQPYGYHLTSILFHTFNAFLVYLFCLELFKDKSDNLIISILAGMFFLILPNHVEAVVWVSAIGDPLATFFYLLSFYLYVKYSSFLQEVGDRKIISFLSLIFFIFSLLTKEIAITLPVLLLAYEVIINNNYRVKNLFNRLRWYFFILIGYLVYRYWAIGLFFGYYSVKKLSIQPLLYLKNLINFDIGSLIYGDYRIIFAEFIFRFWYIYLFLFSFLLLWMGYCLVLRINKRFNFLVFFWLLNIVLVLPLGMSSLNDEGERYAYLASFALAILLAWLSVLICQNKKVWGGVVTVVLVFYLAYNLDVKLKLWNQASLISKSIYTRLGDFNYQDFKKSYFIGLPDNYQGAQVMRNGLVQALELKGVKGSFERIPVYVTLNKSTAFAPLYNDFQYLSDGFHVTTKNNQFIITGNASEIHDEYKFELWNYDYQRFLSNTIRLQFRGGREFDWARNEILVIYFEQGILKSLKY